MKIKSKHGLLCIFISIVVEFIGFNYWKLLALKIHDPLTAESLFWDNLIVIPAAFISNTIGDITHFYHKELFMPGSIFCILLLYALSISSLVLFVWKWGCANRHRQNVIVATGVMVGGFIVTCAAHTVRADFLLSILLFPYYCTSGCLIMLMNIITGNDIFLEKQIPHTIVAFSIYWVLCGVVTFYVLNKWRYSSKTSEKVITPRCNYAAIRELVYYAIGFIAGGGITTIVVFYSLHSLSKVLVVFGFIVGFPAFFTTSGISTFIESCIQTQINWQWIFGPLLFLCGCGYGLLTCRLVLTLLNKQLYISHEEHECPKVNSPVLAKNDGLFIDGNCRKSICNYCILLFCIILDFLGSFLIIVGLKDLLYVIRRSNVFGISEVAKKGFLLIIIGCIIVGVGFTLFTIKKKATKK